MAAVTNHQTHRLKTTQIHDLTGLWAVHRSDTHVGVCVHTCVSGVCVGLRGAAHGVGTSEGASYKAVFSL